MFCIVALVLQANADERKKSYEKKWAKGDLEEVIINNKHGKIEVVQHAGEELMVVAEMKAVAKTAAKADEALELVQVVEIPIGKKIQFETQFGKEMNIPQFLAGFSLSVDYKVSIPKGMSLRLISSIGDVYVGDFEGDINADIEHGNFKASVLKGGEMM